MTGTALDGFIDAAIIETDGRQMERLGAWRMHPDSAALRARRAEAITAARAWNFNGPAPAAVHAPERDYTAAHAEAVKALAEEAGLALGDIDVIGFHGLTVLHRPQRGGRGRT